MPADKVSALGRELGHELRTRREKAGYNALEFSKRLGWSQTRVSRIETGVKMPTTSELMMYLASSGATRDEINKVLDLANERDRGHRVKDHSDDVNDETNTLIFHERAAHTIDTYDPIFVPTLLQTENYTRARLIEAGVNSTAIIEHRMQCAADRQKVLRQSQPPECTFYISENALVTPIGDTLIMNEQLLHLVFLAAWQHCTIRVVPRATQGIGLAHNGFQRMTFPNQDPMVTINLETNTLILDSNTDTRRYADVVNRLNRAALDEEQSRTLLADLADDYDGTTDLLRPGSQTP